MRNLAGLLISGAVMLGTIDKVQAGSVYSEDFSTDPHWVTDQPQNFHWDEKSETFFVSMSNRAEQYEPNRFAYTWVDWSGGPFRLEWDSKITRSDWSAGINFGLFNNNLNYQGPSTINVEYANPDPGRGFAMFAFSKQEVAVQSNWTHFILNTWYHNKVEYNPISGIVDYEIYNPDTRELFANLDLTIGGEFDKEMDLLGFSRYPAGQSSTSGMDRNGITEGYIDNVRFSSVPEPATLGLLAAGGLVALLSRRKPKG